MTSAIKFPHSLKAPKPPWRRRLRLFAFAALLWAGLGAMAYASTESPPARPDPLQGTEPTAAAVSDHIYRQLLEFIKFSGNTPYQTITANKYLSACIDWSGMEYSFRGIEGRYVGGSGTLTNFISWNESLDSSNSKASAEEALTACKKNEHDDFNCVCAVVAEGDKLVLSPPVAVTERLEAAYQQLESKIKNPTFVLADAEVAISGRRYPMSGAYFPDLGPDLSIMDYDCDESYMCTCLHLAINSISRTAVDEPVAVLARLKQLERFGLFDCVDVKQLEADSMRTRPRRMCHFIHRIDGPTELDGALDGYPPAKDVRSVWLEAAVEVDANGVPIDAPVGGMRVVAVQTSSGLFLGIKFSLPDPGLRCAVGVPFQNKAFDFTNCTDKAACGNKAYIVFRRHLEQSMPNSALKAQLDLSGGALDDELLFRHQRGRSDILGAAYWEDNSYYFRFYQHQREDTFDFPGRERFLGVGTTYDDMFIRMTYDVLTRVGPGSEYASPEPSLEARFNDAAKAVFLQTLVDSCRELNGQMLNDVCHLRG